MVYMSDRSCLPVHPAGDMITNTMPYDPEIHHRRSLRLRSWDYTWPWWYFVTIVVENRQCLFGAITDDHVELSELGRTAQEYWRQIPQHNVDVELDNHVIMPNHMHGIIILNDSSCGDVQLNVPTENTQRFFRTRSEAMAALSPRKQSLSVIIRTFKAAVTTWARRNGFQDFAWQSRFYDHIIRNEADLDRIRTYIANNPLQWAIDEENPEDVITPNHVHGIINYSP
jgi:REP element-mobilizing transposase RayT